jgi:hypothetical protein
VREIAGPQRATDFRIEELGSESWRVTPLTAQANDYVERPGVKQGSWQRNGEAYLLGSSWVALDLMRHLASCGFLLENHWLDPLRKPVARPPAEHVPERDAPPPKESPSSTDVKEGKRMKERAPHGHPPKAGAEDGELKQYVFRVDQWWAFSSLACVKASSLEEGESLAADEAWVDKEHGQRESIRATLLEVDGRPAEREHAPGPRPGDFDTYPGYIRERVESFEKILARYPDTVEHGRLVCLLTDARHWADQHEVDFGLCLGLSRELHANEVKEQAETPEEEPGREPGY